MERIRAGRALCALCNDVIRPDEDAFVTPDFLADDSDPFWRFSDAPMHRACFLVWDQRKAFVYHYNQRARRWATAGGPCLRMTSEGMLLPPPLEPRTIEPAADPRPTSSAPPQQGSS